MRIGFIGNFTVSHSTENERKWSFEKLGHTVIPFQENQTTKKTLLDAIPDLDVLIYSHTHDPSYVIENLVTVFEQYKKAGVPTVSVHLDRWMGLERQKDMGQEATWSVEYIFMADGSPEAIKEYERLGLNWHWLKPGVVERDCYMAEPDRKRFPHDIVFVGSRGYHPEYMWRPQLVQWLHDTYGAQFGHYGNDGIEVVRGADLNTLYASAKIVVGDSCFAGDTKDYWSDRIPETTGRGGFLIHPQVKGCDHAGVSFFEPKNFDHLKATIDLCLDDNSEREMARKLGFEWTRDFRTYTHLAQEMINIIFNK